MMLARLKKTIEKEYPTEKPSGYEPTGNVQLNLKQTKLADTFSREWSLQSKNFDKAKAMPYIESIIKSLGVDKVENLRRQTTRYSKERGITKFHELVQQELQANEALASNASKSKNRGRKSCYMSQKVPDVTNNKPINKPLGRCWICFTRGKKPQTQLLNYQR